MLIDKNDYLNLEDLNDNSDTDENKIENSEIDNSILKNMLIVITNEFRGLDFIEIKENFSNMLKKIYDELIVFTDNTNQSNKLKTSLRKYLSIIMEIFFGFADQMSKSNN